MPNNRRDYNKVICQCFAEHHHVDEPQFNIKQCTLIFNETVLPIFFNVGEGFWFRLGVGHMYEDSIFLF